MNELEIGPREWLDIFERDYLASFVREGGATTKVLVVEPEIASELTRGLSSVAERHGLLEANVDQAVQKVYYMDRLFNEVADRSSGSIGESSSCAVPCDRTGTPCRKDLVVDEVATANSIDVSQVRITVQQLLTSSVLKDYKMASDSWWQ